MSSPMHLLVVIVCLISCSMCYSGNMDLKGVTVALDGSGNYTTIMEAIAAAPEKKNETFVIWVKKGVYSEYLVIGKRKWNLVLIGEGRDVTTITGNRSVQGSGGTLKTFKTATVAVFGQGFIAKSIGFENTAGPSSKQAVALLSMSDHSVFYRCAFRGFQDTLYVKRNVQFYRECEISGTVDFVFGNGTAVFQNCSIYVRNGMYKTIAAHARNTSWADTGFSFQFCSITYDIEEGLPSVPHSAYLGRPWGLYARTVFMESYVGDIIKSEGWIEWGKNVSVANIYYGEYKNSGPGANLEGRVKWTSFHMMNMEEAEKFTVVNFIDGDSWLPSTGVEYTGGLGS